MFIPFVNDREEKGANNKKEYLREVVSERLMTYEEKGLLVSLSFM